MNFRSSGSGPRWDLFAFGGLRCGSTPSEIRVPMSSGGRSAADSDGVPPVDSGFCDNGWEEGFTRDLRRLDKCIEVLFDASFRIELAFGWLQEATD